MRQVGFVHVDHSDVVVVLVLPSQHVFGEVEPRIFEKLGELIDCCIIVDGLVVMLLSIILLANSQDDFEKGSKYLGWMYRCNDADKVPNSHPEIVQSRDREFV